jgi:hypothetical protein
MWEQGSKADLLWPRIACVGIVTPGYLAVIADSLGREKSWGPKVKDAPFRDNDTSASKFHYMRSHAVEALVLYPAKVKYCGNS